MLLRRLLRELTAPADDPRVVFADPRRTQERLLTDIREALERLDASRTRFAARAEETRGRLATQEEHARRALRAGEQEQARAALTLAEVARAELAAHDRQHAAIDHEHRRLTLVEQRLFAALAAHEAREQLLSARYTAAEAQVRAHEALAGVTQDLAGLTPALELAEQRAETMEARAGVVEQLFAVELPELDGIAAGSDSGADVEHAVALRLKVLARELAAEGPGAPDPNG